MSLSMFFEERESSTSKVSDFFGWTGCSTWEDQSRRRNKGHEKRQSMSMHVSDEEQKEWMGCKAAVVQKGKRGWNQ